MSIRPWSSKLITVAFLLLLQSCSSNKTGFVDVFKLVEGFELQKDYTLQARGRYEAARVAIDSIVRVEALKDTIRAKSLYQELHNSLAQNVEVRNKEIEKMLWKRLNPYVSDYGKEKGYKYIYGANGTGNVLYADQSEDITDALINYVNKRYHGNK